MKQLGLVLPLLLSILAHNLSAQFEFCNSSTNQNLWDVHFTDEKIGIAVGDSGTIIRSTDGGLNWNTVMTADSVHFKKVSFFDASRGLAIGTHVFKTDDGGMNWSIIPLSNETFIDVEVFESGKCLVSGIPVALMQSKDYGMTWDTLIQSHPDNGLGLIDFIDEDTGFACIKGPHFTNRVYKTEDGGGEWNMIQSMTGEDNSIIESLDFYSEDIGIRGGWYNPHLTRTETGAEDWDVVAIDSIWFQFQMYDVHIGKGENASFWGCGWHGLVVRSDDLGKNWEFMGSAIPTDQSLFGIHFLNDQLGWIVGREGIVLRTENGGGAVSVQDPFFSKGMTVYPNPTSGMLNIEASERINFLRIIDMKGQTVIENDVHSSVDLSDLVQGIYFIIVYTDAGQFVKKLVKD